jgi:hypothetical protein
MSSDLMQNGSLVLQLKIAIGRFGQAGERSWRGDLLVDRMTLPN